MTPDEVARITELAESDNLARSLGVELAEVTDDGVVLRLAVEQGHVGWHGRAHGGVLFTLADIAMSYIGNRGPQTAYATHTAMDFVSGVDAGDTVVARARETARNGRAAVYDVEIAVDGRVVGLFRGNAVEGRTSTVQPKD